MVTPESRSGSDPRIGIGGAGRHECIGKTRERFGLYRLRFSKIPLKWLNLESKCDSVVAALAYVPNAPPVEIVTVSRTQ
jgi:hypothetical protein